MNWAADRRQEFILGRLKAHGCLLRRDICDEFRISLAQASADISTFLAENLGAMIYNKRAKRYEVAELPVRITRRPNGYNRIYLDILPQETL